MTTSSSPISSIEKFLRKMTAGYDQQQKVKPSHRQVMPDYVAESTLALFSEIIDGLVVEKMPVADSQKLLQLALNACAGPMSSQHGRNDDLLSELFKKTQFNPWKNNDTLAKKWLETCFEQNWPKTLKKVITHPDAPKNWSNIPLFSHHTPLMQVAAMRNIDLLPVVIKAGANPSVVYKNKSCLLRAASPEHVTCLLEDVRVHEHLAAYIQSLVNHKQDDHLIRRLEAVVRAMKKHKTLANANVILKPFIDGIVENPAANRKIWTFLSAIKDPSLPKNWMTFDIKGKSTKFSTYNGWALEAGLCHQKLYQLRSSRTHQSSISLEISFESVNTKWNQDSIKGIPQGVWPALLLFAQPSSTEIYRSLIPKSASAKTLLKNKDVSYFIPFMGGDPISFWKGVEKALPLFGKENQWAKGQILTSLVTEPLWQILPDYPESMPGLMREWFFSSDSKKAKEGDSQKLFISAMATSTVFEMEQGRFNAQLDDLKKWLEMIVKSELKPSEGIPLLEAYMNQGKIVAWDDEWNSLYEKVLKKSKSSKNVLPILEKWKLQMTLREVTDAPIRKLRL